MQFPQQPGSMNSIKAATSKSEDIEGNVEKGEICQENESLYGARKQASPKPGQ